MKLVYLVNKSPLLFEERGFRGDVNNHRIFQLTLFKPRFANNNVMYYMKLVYLVNKSPLLFEERGFRGEVNEN
jgi:hypothetical protein